MNAETFCEHFATFADAPNGMAELRELILQLAVKGRLVAQENTEEPASVLSTQIAKDRITYLGSFGGISRRDLPPVVADEMQMSLPNTWCWCRMGDLSHAQAGFAFKSAFFNTVGEGMPIIRIRDIFNDQTATFYTGEFREEFVVQKGDYLIGMDGNFNVSRWRGSNALLNQRVARLQWYSDKFEPRFVTIALQHRLRELQGKKAYTTVDHLSNKQIEESAIPLPPRAEQQRIVEKVDQLLGLCDELAARQAAQREKRQRLVGATLDRLVSTRNPAEFPTHAHRLRNHFDQLFDTPTTIPQLRQTILLLAVQGQLVPQDPNDKPVESVRVGEVVSFLGGYAFKSEWFQERPGIRLVRNQNISHGQLDWSDTEYLPETRREEFTKFELHPGDMVLSLNRPFISTGLKLAWIKDSDCPCLLVQRVACMRPARDRLLPEFLYLWCNAPDFYRNAHVVPSSGVPYIATNRVELMSMTLPSLAEQKRIVTKVTELLSLCDALEAKLTQAESASTQLLPAAVHSLLEAS